MTQAYWLDRMHSKNFFKEKKANQGFLEYSLQKSASNFCIFFRGN